MVASRRLEPIQSSVRRLTDTLGLPEPFQYWGYWLLLSFVLQAVFGWRVARELGAPRVGRVALDGTKIKANASKHKAMSYGRMRQREAQLREEIGRLIEQGALLDAILEPAEDATAEVSVTSGEPDASERAISPPSGSASRPAVTSAATQRSS